MGHPALCPHDVHGHVAVDCRAWGICAAGQDRTDTHIQETDAQDHAYECISYCAQSV